MAVKALLDLAPGYNHLFSLFGLSTWGSLLSSMVLPRIFTLTPLSGKFLPWISGWLTSYFYMGLCPNINFRLEAISNLATPVNFISAVVGFPGKQTRRLRFACIWGCAFRNNIWKEMKEAGQAEGNWTAKQL